jgi:O-methyltransferase involved in polyketide biosynthesis
MAERKRRAMKQMGSLSDHHRVVDVDALKPGGPGSLTALTAELDPDAGLIIVTEGLLGYLSTADMTALWERFANVLVTFSAGGYVSDLHLGDAVTPVIRGFRVLLGAFVRGRVYLHFDSAEQAERALLAAGFRAAQVVPASTPASAPANAPAGAAGQSEGRPGRSGDGQASARLAHILEAST